MAQLMIVCRCIIHCLFERRVCLYLAAVETFIIPRAVPWRKHGALQHRCAPIIYIPADGAGNGDPGCLGQREVIAPHIDRMAAEGMRFTNNYAGAAPAAVSPVTAVLTAVLAVFGYFDGKNGVMFFRELPGGGSAA